jgi:tetratricopeptide (TPR) repeat protein
MEATQRFTAADAARVLNASESQVLTFARLGGIEPATGTGGIPTFTFQQLLLLRTTQGLVAAGVPPRRVRKVWTSLRRQLRSDLPLTSIRILADGERAIAWDGRARWQPESGQFLLDFDAGEVAASAAAPAARGPSTVGRSSAARVAPAAVSPSGARAAGERACAGSAAAGTLTAEPEPAAGPGPPGLTAEQWFHIASELEAESPVEARRAYLHALELDPALGDAHLNLGRLEHEAGELGRAEAHYRTAVRCAPGDATCHYNLGVLLEDRGRPEEAIHAYRQALERDPDLGDAHYNLGLLLEARGRRAEAIGHLMTARRLYGEAGRGR